LELESAGDSVGWGARRRERRESASPLESGEVRRKAQGGARASSSGHDIAKSGGVVVGPGL
jgi:ribosomal protein L4